MKTYLTPTEIINKYPELNLKFKWDARGLGLMLRFGLMDGYYDRTRRTAKISEESLLLLIEYVNNLLEKQKIQTQLLQTK